MHGIDTQTQRPTRYRLSLYFLCKKPKSNGGGACLLSTKLPEEKKKKKKKRTNNHQPEKEKNISYIRNI